MSEQIKVYNPRVLVREGLGELLKDAADPSNIVLVRAGRAWSPVPEGMAPRVEPKDDRPLKRPMIRVDTNHGVNAYGSEAGSKVFRLVEVPEAEIEALQKRYDDQNGFDTIG